MKKIKNIIIIVLVIILIILALMFLLKRNKEAAKEEFSMPYGDERIIEREIHRVYRNIDYYSVDLIARGYLYSIISQDNDMLYNTVNPESINELDINKENVISKLNKDINSKDTNIEHYRFIVEDMYFSESEGNIVTYFVYMKIINIASEDIIKTSLMVETDTMNNTYYILPFEYMNNKGYVNIEEGQEYTTDIEVIENNSYNEIQYENLNEYDIIVNLMDKVTNEMVYDTDNSYNMFDNEYKKLKFDTLDKYRKYVNNNMRYIISSSIEKYKINKYDDYTEYICIDQNGNYYIFNETSPMKFTVKLDSYTIDILEFIEKYNSGNAQTKVAMNIEKVIQALNNKDYNYIYGKLDETFKQNNFDTINKFEEYMKNNFFEKNKIDSGVYSKEGDIHTYELKIEEKDGEAEEITNEETDVELDENNTNSKGVTIIMKLLEDRNFVMSFSIN